MEKSGSRLNLIDRLSEKLEPRKSKSVEQVPLVERAMAKLAGMSPDQTPAAPVNGSRASAANSSDDVAHDRGAQSVIWTEGEARNFVEIDLERMNDAGYVVPDGRRKRIKEQYRAIKRPLLTAAFERDGTGGIRSHVILVTSASPGEGKTFTATNLAMSIASEREIKVLLVDGDVIRQDLAQRFGIEASRGYLDLLEDGNLDAADVLVRTNIPSLAILPAGPARENATELFASSRMTDLMQELASRYRDRIIIIDSPPVLASSETAALSMHAGQVVLVVEAGQTERQTVDEALQILASCEQVSCILNKAVDSDLSEKYGSYYEYYPSHSRG